MKNFMLSVAFLLIGSFGFANEPVSELENQKTTTEFVIVTNAEGANTCYARKCTTYTGSDGYEYKNCTDWEEVDCRAVVLAQ